MSRRACRSSAVADNGIVLASDKYERIIIDRDARQNKNVNNSLTIQGGFVQTKS
jgi:hypothetical protein